MSIEIRRPLQVVPIERKQPQQPFRLKRLARRSQPKRIVVRRKEEPPCPPR